LTFAILIVLAVAGITFTIGWRPFIGPKKRALTARTFERTPQRLERGRYLVTAVAACFDCHSEHDWKAHAAPVLPGMEGGGEVMPLVDLPGRVVAPNITSDKETGVGDWTDDELARAIREGVSREGRALFPLMPYGRYKSMSDEDLASVIVYLRSVPPVHHSLPATKIDFPVNLLIRSAPEPVTAPVTGPAANASDLDRGTYLVTIAGCEECHTPQVRGKPIAGMRLAGGFRLRGAWGDVAASNLTPDDSGIKYYDQPLFLQAMRTGYVKARELNPIMPYANFKNMTDEDLQLIFRVLQSATPVKHRVDNSEPPTECKLCRQKHGAGQDN
jgi:mono/diheme cytochrome c family protein